MDAGANCNLPNYESKTPLSAAASEGRTEVLHILLGKESSTTDVDGCNEDGWTALIHSADRGHLECARVLVEHHANIDVVTTNGATALWVATKRGYNEIVRLLLNRSTAVVDVPVGGMTPLMVAAAYGYMSIVQLLLDVSAKFDAKNADGKTPVDLAVEHNHVNCKVLLLLRQQHPLLYFAKAGDLPRLMAQLEIPGVSVDERDDTRKTALMYAAVSGHTHIMRHLLSHGADMHAFDMNGATALSLASGECRALLEREMLHLLVRQGKHQALRELLDENDNLDIEQPDEDGTTLLMTAVDSGEADIVKLLLDQNADLNAKRVDGKTPLILATEGNHLGSKAYLEKEALFREKFPLLYEARSDNVVATRKLLEAGAQVDERDDDGWSALMYAASMNNVGVLKVLLDFGASIGGSDKGGKTAFMVAPNKEAFVKLILEQSSSELRFSEQMFKGAIECDPKLGKAILDEFVIERGRYNLEFRELDRIYGKGEVHESALYSIMHLDTAEPEAKEAVKQYCLQHPMIRRVLQLKWEFFAQRLYIEQFLAYMLLLMSSIISGSFYQLDEAPRNVLKELENFFQPDWTASPIPVVTSIDGTVTEQVDSSGFRLAFNVWLVTFVYVIVAYAIAHYGLKPKRICALSKWCREGTYFGLVKFIVWGDYTELDWSEQIPDMKQWKSYAMKLLFVQSLLWTAVLGIPLFAYIATRSDAEINASKDFIQMFQNFILWLAALYFFRWEVKEMMGYGTRNYFTSIVNTMQMITFCVILFFYVPCQLQIIPETIVARQTQLVCSGLTTLSLWVLFLQFLEIIPSAGYLLPMMKGLMRDLTRFSILYGVFQCGLTCCYYILFQGKIGHESMLKSFSTVFFVLFGQLDQVLEAIDSEKADQPLLYVVGYILLMFHCAAAIVLLLNVLIAMMNVTMQMGLENARIEALVSYAHCILRLELSLQPQERLEMIYIIKPKFLKDIDPAMLYSAPESSITGDELPEFAIKRQEANKFRSIHIKNVVQRVDETQPLIVSASEEGAAARPNAVGILNPAFYEKTTKSEYAPLVEIPDNSTVQFQNDVKAALTTIKKEHAQQLNQLKVQIAELTKSILDYQATTAPSGMVSM
ncbi:hypothetical protein, variant 4 [Aphanomyces invadans]|nr:hypothetical protein, variant 4 [Aphanomyces invadans]XP_008879975.1 hypothetical protein, variant 1 [Aphanomyces invadans]XP_008879976.1 hypothetical protein, variant 2 [Aphanomyces invadans]XP_008879977.1 hypothetical protein, variant 3 [Aphanomyces invadans]ETV91346.1 hypothetical protein, variant 1 [Aphanomyces invadans]ETV91347.1 hypothetical protein, variant 2 [Aphanomyces invadans]ETV91348.1 hypothetical protein, variant 3 [Aphanomyces invadans]ETV91349.1 hypothetical protein, vari|eukprot:XP_008879974.1 hypothetical protein, variant 4 [Aphanomyces invadans]